MPDKAREPTGLLVAANDPDLLAGTTWLGVVVTLLADTAVFPYCDAAPGPRVMGKESVVATAKAPGGSS